MVLQLFADNFGIHLAPVAIVPVAHCAPGAIDANSHKTFASNTSIQQFKITIST